MTNNTVGWIFLALDFCVVTELMIFQQIGLAFVVIYGLGGA